MSFASQSSSVRTRCAPVEGVRLQGRGLAREAFRVVGKREAKPCRARIGLRVLATSEGDSKAGTEFWSEDKKAKLKAPVPFSFGASRSADPFAAAVRPVQDPTTAPVGFSAEGLDRSTLLSVGESETLLRRFDREQRKAAGEYGKTVAGAPGCTNPPLKAATLALAANSSHVMVGFCASDQKAGLRSLKAWTAGLGLPKGRLHGMDLNGKPISIPGAVYMKYNSSSGDAVISGYAGEYRGVLFTPQLPDGEFRQYGYLPLGLHEE
eukprot:CAMPEP_0118932898 /NCGR_PEP_ID=MMETSP1169-20130426/10678_1 /TAXON_ID=36882 /ORGANISM="Pyramimonas obovata, Strain CCMP722" /LENGTH=264 /DNA_ID=CAMNT_0006875603 /DNA_START=31 /DNA_END=825 /DNA_ORIENTATION=-